MRRVYLTSGLLLSCAILFQGCRSLNPSIMLKTGKGYQFAAFPPSQPVEYKIAPNDQLSFQIFSNDGFKLIDVTTITEGGGGGAGYMQAGGGMNYKVEFDGTVKMPLLGHIALKDMTVRQAEVFLEEKFALFYNKPFVLLEVTNRKVTIFPGSEGSAKVVTLKNENTTLLEGLAEAGGISNNGKAYNIKLIRGDLKNPQVYLIDLSTIDGMKRADLVLQANDIIYVEPTIRVDKEIISEILPYLTFITTILLFVEFIKRTP
ncbi:MAG: polysaccharide export protein EpsE [Bacteroidetes bacterium]|nr:MAG: polysaccharide export protein EpsE [Bacteroidota bacterium]